MPEKVISQSIQDAFVFMSITDAHFLSMVRGVVKPEYFSSVITENIVRISYNYYDQFKVAPENHLQDEVGRLLKGSDKEEKDRYFVYLTKIGKMKPPNQGYVIKRINDFIKAREFEEAAVKFVNLTELGNFAEAKELMQHALRVGIEREEVGLRYFDKMIPTYYGKEGGMGGVLIPTGFREIDTFLKGLRRGQFLCILGGYKGKKSWCCIHLAKEALLRGLKVLHISHEMSLAEAEMRYDMALGVLTSETEAEDVMFVELDDDGNEVRRWQSRVESVYNLEAVREVRRKLRKFGGELIIRKYPMGTCSIGEIDRYLDYLETFEDFIPDIIINDYVEIMKLPLGQTAAFRDRINQAYIDHKRIADERNVLVITVSQVVRQKLRAKRLSQRDFAEDIRKMGNADIVLALSQSETQALDDRMTVYVLANRMGRQDFGCVIKMNLAAGQLCIGSYALRPEEGERE